MHNNIPKPCGTLTVSLSRSWITVCCCLRTSACSAAICCRCCTSRFRRFRRASTPGRIESGCPIGSGNACYIEVTQQYTQNTNVNGGFCSHAFCERYCIHNTKLVQLCRAHVFEYMASIDTHKKIRTLGHLRCHSLFSRVVLGPKFFWSRGHHIQYPPTVDQDDMVCFWQPSDCRRPSLTWDGLICIDRKRPSIAHVDRCLSTLKRTVHVAGL